MKRIQNNSFIVKAEDKYHRIKFVKSSKFSNVDNLLLLFANPNLHFVKTRSNLNSRPFNCEERVFILSLNYVSVIFLIA